jgi:hypothetical protein
MILYKLNRKHTNFQLNWTEGVAYRNYTICSTKVKAHPGFGPLPVGKPD